MPALGHGETEEKPIALPKATQISVNAAVTKAPAMIARHDRVGASAAATPTADAVGVDAVVRESVMKCPSRANAVFKRRRAVQVPQGRSLQSAGANGERAAGDRKSG